MISSKGYSFFFKQSLDFILNGNIIEIQCAHAYRYFDSLTFPRLTLKMRSYCAEREQTLFYQLTADDLKLLI